MVPGFGDRYRASGLVSRELECVSCEPRGGEAGLIFYFYFFMYGLLAGFVLRQIDDLGAGIR